MPFWKFLLLQQIQFAPETENGTGGGTDTPPVAEFPATDIPVTDFFDRLDADRAPIMGSSDCD